MTWTYTRQCAAETLVDTLADTPVEASNETLGDTLVQGKTLVENLAYAKARGGGRES